MLKKSLSVLILLLFTMSILAGCGGGIGNTSKKLVSPADYNYSDSKDRIAIGGMEESSKAEVKFSEANGAAENISSNLETEAGAVPSSSEANGITTTTSTSSDNALNNAILSQRKIIRNAFVAIEVENFDSAYSRIKSMISAYGFIQESNIKKDKVHVAEGEKSITRGTIIIRVDKDRFDSVLGDLKGLGTLINENIKSDDVTDKFFDTESRLRLIKYEETRLEEYLKKTSDPDTIFKIESRLTNIRHEIESLTGNLNKMKDLVQLSTITIEMSEKYPESKPQKEATYWEKLKDSFAESIEGVVDFFSELLLVIVQLLPVLVVLAVILFAVIMFYKKVLNKRFRLVSKKAKEKKIEYYDEGEEQIEGKNEEENEDENIEK